MFGEIVEVILHIVPNLKMSEKMSFVRRLYLFWQVCKSRENASTIKVTDHGENLSAIFDKNKHPWFPLAHAIPCLLFVLEHPMVMKIDLQHCLVENLTSYTYRNRQYI